MLGIKRNTQAEVNHVNRYYELVQESFGIKPIIAGAPPLPNKLSKLVKRERGSLVGRMFEFFLVHLEDIITCPPEKLRQRNEEMLLHVAFDPTSVAHSDQMVIFKRKMESYYDRFFPVETVEDGIKSSIGRWMTRELGLNVCAFCNHNYTLTVNGRTKGVRPDFDHFFSKSKYPLLALSFYNLIPICTTCNKLKGDEELVHSPYDDSLPFPKFRLFGKDSATKKVLFGLGQGLTDIEIDTDANYTLSHSQFCNVDRLAIKEVYEQQLDYVNDILDAAQQYNAGNYDAIVHDFQGLGKQPAEIDRIIWGYYENQHHKRPLSKLTQDILEQIGRKGR